ncbi:hypothetical protein T265_02752 [Opisthorchis viverrini]|uniref:C2H2-type domain-containing protein n=1 Tax=Opisthorchis viverrini TaxID=6198 RepID=A0A075AI35_OPIVI|nr:hypothetical protein T265_02752 [Opisthorchis viverrini]KER30944.1 hypothetical protein T265_02752 [Opisthorchis viverrini]
MTYNKRESKAKPKVLTTMIRIKYHWFATRTPASLDIQRQINQTPVSGSPSKKAAISNAAEFAGNDFRTSLPSHCLTAFGSLPPFTWLCEEGPSRKLVDWHTQHVAKPAHHCLTAFGSLPPFTWLCEEGPSRKLVDWHTQHVAKPAQYPSSPHHALVSYGHWFVAKLRVLPEEQYRSAVQYRSCVCLQVVLAFSCSTLLVPSCHATRRKHEGWDTARLPKPRQEKSSGGSWIRTTNLPTLIDRRFRALCTEEIDRTAAQIEIANKLQETNRPVSLIKRPLRRILAPVPRPKASAVIRRLLNLANIRAAFQKGKTLRSFVVQWKDPLPVERTRDCVHKINCNECALVYIGQTARELHTRIGEHKRRINKPPRNAEEYQTLVKDSAMAVHALDTGHRIDLENVEVLRRGLRFTPQRLIAEAVEITKHHSVNRIEGVELASSLDLTKLLCQKRNVAQQ